MKVSRCVAIGLLGLAFALIGGCGGGGGSTAVDMADGTIVRQEPRAASLVQPVVVDGADGLEVMWWITTDEGGAAGDAIAKLPDASDFLSSEESTNWRGNGLRMARVAMDDLDQVLSDLPPQGRLNRQWIGWSPRWREFVRGRSLGGDAPLLLNGTRVRLDRGVGRIIGRVWRGPGVGRQDELASRGVIFAELAVQVHREAQVDAASFYMAPRAEPAENLGEILPDMSVRGCLDPAYAYVIVAENPRVEWDAEGMVETKESGGERQGPATSPLRSVGEAMLTGSAVETRRSPVRVVIVLLPRLRTEYSLLPADGS